MRWLPLLSVLFFAAPLTAQEITHVDDRIDFKIDGELVTSYYIGKEVAKPYWWPLNAPGKITVTRGYPVVKDLPNELSKDHPHHKSGWFCHGDVIPEGLALKTKSADKNVKGIDFWSEVAGHGIIVCTKVEALTRKDPEATVYTRNEWRTADGEKVMDERRTITLRKFDKTGRMLIVESELKASVCPITFGDTKEGSFGIRISDQMREEIEKKTKGTGIMTNAEGKSGEKAVWGYISPWCDYSGKQDGHEAGLAIFASPKNSQPSAWHSRAYGLMAANPFGREHAGFPSQKGKTELVKLAKDDTLKLTYAIYLHTGDAKSGQVAQAYEEFAKR